MSGYQKIVVIGNLGQDPEMRFTPSGKPVTTFSVACNDGQDTEWFNVVCWNKTAELANQYLEKGKQVCVEGRIQTRKWEDQTGATKYKTELIANRVVFLSGKARTPDENDTDIEPEDLF